MTAGARIVVAFAAASILLAALPAQGQAIGMSAIETTGPLSSVWVTADLGCQVHQKGWTHNAFAPGQSRVGACGTFLSIQPHDVPSTLYGPNHLTAVTQPDPTASVPPPASARALPYVVLDEQRTSGAGTGADPFVIESRVLAGPIEVLQRDSYVAGAASYTTEITVTNPGPEHPDVVLWRAATCDLGKPTYGASGSGWVACTTEPAWEQGQHIVMQAAPGTGTMEGPAQEVWARVASMQGFPDSCDCDRPKAGAIGLSWSLHLEPGNSVVVVHETRFGQDALAPPPVPPPPPSVEPECGTQLEPSWCEPPAPGRVPVPHYWPAVRAGAQAPPTISGTGEARQAFLDTPGGASGSADGDGVDDAHDLCLGTVGGASDLDGDGRGDACDDDRDGDGLLDGLDACADDPDVGCGVASPEVADVRPGNPASRKPIPTTIPPAPGAGSVDVTAGADGRSVPVVALAALAGTLLLLMAGLRRRVSPP